MDAKTITEQELILSVIERMSFNYLDGAALVESLRANEDLWRAVVPGDVSGHSCAGLVALRDLAGGNLSMDTLYLLPRGGKEEQLELLVRREWKADEIGWISGEAACALLGRWSPKLKMMDKQILRVWWD